MSCNNRWTDEFPLNCLVVYWVLGGGLQRGIFRQLMHNFHFLSRSNHLQLPSNCTAPNTELRYCPLHLPAYIKHVQLPRARVLLADSALLGFEARIIPTHILSDSFTPASRFWRPIFIELRKNCYTPLPHHSFV